MPAQLAAGIDPSNLIEGGSQFLDVEGFVKAGLTGKLDKAVSPGAQVVPRDEDNPLG